MEIEAIKKEHMETTLNIENQKKRQGAVSFLVQSIWSSVGFVYAYGYLFL